MLSMNIYMGRINRSFAIQKEMQIMNEASERAKRPPVITVICILGFLEAIIEAPFIFSPEAQQIGSWYPPYGGLYTVLMLVCMIGLWKMKKWAAYTYTGSEVLNQIILIAMGLWTVWALPVVAVYVFFVLKHVSKMS